MSDDRMESVSLQSRILFGCGIVLGVCLGFAAGHITVWSRISRSENAVQNPFEVHGSADVRSLNLDELDRSDFNDRPRASQRNDVPGPFFAEAARRLRTPKEEAALHSQSVRVATDTSPPTPAPETFPLSQAAPIDGETQLREQVTRTIIAQELPQLTEQEQEIWFDVLRGMEAADVKGILRMRKHVGGDPTSAFGMRLVGPDVATPAPPRRIAKETDANDDRWATTLDSLRQIRDIRLHNLANAETIGFIRQIPVTNEINGIAGQGGTQLVYSELDEMCGAPCQTGGSLDVAIGGKGFFQVRQQDEIRLTRCGRFTLDEERHLILLTTSEPWRLDPPIVLPEKVASVVFHPNGQVSGMMADSGDELELGTILLKTVDTPAALEPVGEGLYTVTDHSGPIREQESGGEIYGRSVERMSAGSREAEMEALERVTMLIGQMMMESSAR